jgi:hypothetical protein
VSDPLLQLPWVWLNDPHRDPDARAKLLQEAQQITAGLEHKNIVRV